MGDARLEQPAAQELEGLSARAAQGDRRAFQTLVEQTHRTVYRLVLRMLRSETEAEDVVQEVYVRAWQGLGGIRDHRAVLAWLCQIGRYAAQDRLRARRYTESIDRPIDDAGLKPLVELLASEEATPEERFGSVEVQAAVRRALEGLKEKHRIVLTLREIDGLQYDEIAAALGCSIGTVESRLHRARQALLKKLQKVAREMGGL